MRARLLPPRLAVWLVLGLNCLGWLAWSAQGEEMKIQAVLVWATDDSKPPPGKNYQPLQLDLRNRLRALKWKNYFEVRRVEFTASSAQKRITVSPKCELDVRALGNSIVEVTLFGKGKQVAKVKGALPKNEILVPAGDAPNETAWLVILKRID